MQESIRVTYQGVVAREPLRAAVQRELGRLERFRPAMEDCQLELQRWHQHHQQGSSYRVALEVNLPQRSLKLARESALGADQLALELLLHSTVSAAERALTRLSADPQLGRHLLHSEEARRLHALHGHASGDL